MRHGWLSLYGYRLRDGRAINAFHYYQTVAFLFHVLLDFLVIFEIFSFFVKFGNIFHHCCLEWITKFLVIIIYFW